MSSEKCAFIECCEVGKHKIIDLRVFQMRAEPIPINKKGKMLYFKHYMKFDALYTKTYGKECCNPHKEDLAKRHLKPRKTKLKEINLELASRYKLIPGKKVCVDCLNHLKDSRKDRIEEELSLPEFESPPMEFNETEPETSILDNTFGNFNCIIFY